MKQSNSNGLAFTGVPLQIYKGGRALALYLSRMFFFFSHSPRGPRESRPSPSESVPGAQPYFSLNKIESKSRAVHLCQLELTTGLHANMVGDK